MAGGTRIGCDSSVISCQYPKRHGVASTTALCTLTTASGNIVAEYAIYARLHRICGKPVAAAGQRIRKKRLDVELKLCRLLVDEDTRQRIVRQLQRFEMSMTSTRP